MIDQNTYYTVNEHTKQIRLMQETLVKAYDDVDDMREAIKCRDKSVRFLARCMQNLRGMIAKKDAEIASLKRQLAIYTNCDSPSGKDPFGYEKDKRFRKEMDSSDDTKGTDEEPSGTKQPNVGGGQPGHVGKSHNMKPECMVTYKETMCEHCGRATLEYLKPINKPVLYTGTDKEKHAYMAIVTFGWCDICGDVTDPAPHLVWGSSMSEDVRATIIQYKSNPLGRSSIQENLEVLHGFPISAGAISNVFTAQSNSLEGRVLPNSVAAFVKAKREASRERDARLLPAYTDNTVTTPVSIDNNVEQKPTTKKELRAAERNVPYDTTPQGVTDTRLVTTTTIHPNSRKLSFMETVREVLTMEPYMGLDETKCIVDKLWCHAIVATSPRAVLISVRPHKNIITINWLFGGMRSRYITHDRIVIYNGFTGWHQECWLHLIRRFRRLARDNGLNSPEYARYMVILDLYRRAKDLAHNIAERVGIPTNAAQMAACKHDISRIWHHFEPEYDSIMNGLHGLINDLNGQEPAGYLQRMLPRILTFVKCPGMPGHNNDPESVIRWYIVRPRHVFNALPNWRAAKNFSMLQTFAATCRKNGISPYRAVLAKSQDRDWDVFTCGVPPPIFETPPPIFRHTMT